MCHILYVFCGVLGNGKESRPGVSVCRSACGSVLVGPVESLDLLHLLLAPCARVALRHEGVSYLSLLC